MTNQLTFVEQLPTVSISDNWVLSLSLTKPDGALSGGVRWAEHGPLRGFFSGILFDREALEEAGQSDCSDAELVLRAYARKGDTILSQLRGSFVVAVVDRALGTGLVVRDPMGSHPLFYAEAGSYVSFAATPQSLLDWTGVSGELNRAALADHLCHRWPDPYETFFAAVRRVPPGSRAVVSGGRLAFDRYWDPTPVDQPIEWLSAREVASFDSVFDRAVSRCLRQGPTGVFLSGGLDSISVAAVATDCARRMGQSPPLALSLGFPDPECDEQDRQAAVARELGLRQHLLGFDEAVGCRPMLQQSLELSTGSAAPILNPWQPAYMAIAERGRLDGVRTILTGEGGDEWLSVTPYLAADLIRRGAFLELARFLSTLRRSFQLNPVELFRNVLWQCGLRPLGGMALYQLMPAIHEAGRLERRLRGHPTWVAPDPQLRAEQRRRAKNTMAPANPAQGFYVRELRTGLDHTLISWEAEERYQQGRRLGIHFLHPFSDPDLVKMLYRTPPRLLNEGGRSKGLVRRTLAQRFPDLGLERQRKVLATSFFQTLLLREGPALADIAGDFPALSGLGIVDGLALRDLVLQELKRPTRQLRRIWEPISLEMWVRAYGRKQRASAPTAKGV
jgi:asparagine synthetase B (glutamine-hydrolysing)